LSEKAVDGNGFHTQATAMAAAVIYYHTDFSQKFIRHKKQAMQKEIVIHE